MSNLTRVRDENCPADDKPRFLSCLKAYWPDLPEGCTQDDAYMGCSDLEGEGKQVLVGICAMAKKSQSKPMKEILTRLEEFEYIKIVVFPEEVILKESVENWPVVDCLISFHSKGFPLDKAINYANLRNPFIINNLAMQYDIQDRRRVYAILESEDIEIPRYAVLDRDSPDPKQHELVESEDHVEVNGITFNKPFVEKPVSAEDHNIYIYYPTSAGGGSQRLFRKIGSRSSVYSPESRVRKTGSYIYEDFMPTDGTDVKVYTVGPDYAHAEARKSPALDGKVERDSEGKEIRYPVILSNAEKLISRKVCLAFKQTVCGFDLLRANGQSFVCDVNGFSFVKNSNKYYDDCAKILGNMILRELAPTLHIPWSVPFQLDDPPIVPTTFGKMMELRCVVAVIRHGDRTPKQKMKVEVRHPKFFEIFAKYDGYKHGHVKLKRPKQLQEILDTARSLLAEIQHRAAGPELEEKQGKLEQLKSVLEMYGHFSGINRKVQLKYQPRGRPRGSSSDDGSDLNRLGEPSLVLILKWGGELTPAGRIQAEELGRIFRCMYPGGQGRHLSEEESEMLPSHGEYAGAQGLGLLRLHSTFRHDLKIYASDEGRVQMTAAAFAKGLLALEGELTPILVQMVKSANTNGLLDNDCDSSKYQNMVKTRLHELLQQDREFTREDREQINPGNALSINAALDFVKNPVRCCQHVHSLIQKLLDIVRIKKDDPKTKDTILYHGETWELMGRRWGKIEKDFCTKNKRFDISKIPDIYDCIKYDLQHNNHTLQFEHAEELYTYAKSLADIVIPQEYGLTVQEKLTIGQGICTPLLKKIRADLQRNIEESEESVNRLNPRYSHGVSSPGRHVRTRLYFTSESHVHSLLTVLRYGGLLDVVKDEQWRRAMEYVSMVSELNYMSQIVVMLYEDPTKDPCSEERFHVELHFSPGVNCCVQKNLPPGPGFRPHSRNESSHNVGDNGGSGQDTSSQCSTRIEEEDAELGIMEDDLMNPAAQADTPPSIMETDAVDSMLDSPTTSRAIDMMDLDPNMMDEPYDSGFLQSSAPIPISARTVAGHEAARLGSQLAASQRQRRGREAGAIVEPRSRSYDHQRQEKPEKVTEPTPQESRDDRWTCPRESATLSQSYSSPELPVSSDESFASSCSLHNMRDDRQPPAAATLRSLFDSQIATVVNDLPARQTNVVHCRGRKYGRSHSEVILPNSSAETCDTRPRIIQPDPTCTARRHRHSISGQMSYFKLLGYNVSKKLTGSANSLFSTAVISGSSSAPNLKDMVPPHASAVAAIEGFGGVPPIRPLETLHNALSLRQLDAFLEMMTTAPLYRTPASSPPKSSPAGSTHESLNPPLGHPGIVREYHHSSDSEAVRYIMPTPIQYKSLGEAEACDPRNLPSPTSPNSTGWSSEPQSFLSSEPSSPAPTSTGECSMSISLISNEGAQLFSTAPKFSPAPCLDVDFNEFCMRLDQENRESRGSVSYTDYYSNEDGQIRKITQMPQVIQSGPSNSAQTYGDVHPGDNIDDDEDHTLTLKQSEEQKKQDVKSIFEQREDVNPAKLSGSYKKIGRFRVESTDISHGDVRIKDTDNAGALDRVKPSASQKSDSSSVEKTRKDSKKGSGGSHASSQKRKTFSRSQSVTAPKPAAPKPEATFSYSKQSSFSTMSDADLENWKLSMLDATAPCSSETSQQEQPILTVAGSLTDSSNITVGFDVKEKEKE
ncbi:inositol hexakisphosphate and diphosphoinositol-pentakisphosphate kinase 2 isoform X7 [Ooceraea biroi]|uniref:inositol hexakisphosphate and diphosphoinositol-pentakisphosphate kinase 2 isoform X7 n=1 Tax=Ooceraea biroi TaxID=2015173 RepID=UPI000F08B71F|nr:inositol hexakisphosphate and diphosphoinositol-pentakisphosphate kinase 2 isoform X7 [Ooceraea biroi]XP_026823821.1 inositol hexakisphosphate and diphosphoinositol-pentakisphosphate kinase 2 isoform X7 [Ooceraea biroi]